MVNKIEEEAGSRSGEKTGDQEGGEAGEEAGEIAGGKAIAGQKANTESAFQRFFSRPMQTYIPTLFKKSFDEAAAIRRRFEEQLEIAQKVERRNADMFKKDDLVVCQNPRTGKWTVRGRIVKARTAEDGSVKTFEVKTETGSTTLRNARLIRHQTKKKDVS